MSNRGLYATEPKIGVNNVDEDRPIGGGRHRVPDAHLFNIVQPDQEDAELALFMADPG